LLNLEEIEKYDISKMYQVYDCWADIAEQSYNRDFDLAGYAGIDHIIFAGMGGSGAIGDVFSAILSRTNIHTTVIKGYLLPKTANTNTLVIVTSVSGDTRETLTVLDSANKIGCKILAFSAGGKMEEYCTKNKIEYFKISQSHSPRASFTTFLFSMLKILENIIPIEENDIKETINELQNQQKIISSNNLTETNTALNLAKWIKDIPIIYYPWGLQAAAIRFKNSLQENAKVHCMTEDVIEACHNGIVAWEKPSITSPILIQGNDDFIKTKERWKILKKFFDNNAINYFEIYSNKGNILSKLINLIYILDYASIYHAILNKVDPTPVNSIDFVKKQL